MGSRALQIAQDSESWSALQGLARSGPVCPSSNMAPVSPPHTGMQAALTLQSRDTAGFLLAQGLCTDCCLSLEPSWPTYLLSPFQQECQHPFLRDALPDNPLSATAQVQFPAIPLSP